MTSPSRSLPHPLFYPGGAEALLDDLLRGQLSVRGFYTDDQAEAACQALDLLAFRATVALGLWALPELTPESGIGGLESLTPGAHPFRIEGHLLELTRQGRIGLTGPADAWRRSFQQLAGNCFVWQGAPATASPSLELLCGAIAPSGAGDHADRNVLTARATRLGRRLGQVSISAARLRSLDPDTCDIDVGYTSRRLAARGVALEAVRGHLEDRPLELPPLQEADLLYLASSTEPELRLLGVLLSEQLGVSAAGDQVDVPAVSPTGLGARRSR